MQVVIKVHRSAQAEFEAWRERLATPPFGSDDLARVHTQALFDELIRSEGKPKESCQDTSVSPERWEWKYSGDTLIRFTVRDTPARWFRPLLRTVVILGVEQTGRR